VTDDSPKPPPCVHAAVIFYWPLAPDETKRCPSCGELVRYDGGAVRTVRETNPQSAKPPPTDLEALLAATVMKTGAMLDVRVMCTGRVVVRWLKGIGVTPGYASGDSLEAALRAVIEEAGDA
jgi:hypothetical protein